MLNIQNIQSSKISRADAEMAAEAVIDSLRFGKRSLVDRVLARYETVPEVPALLPSSDEMAANGGDIVAIAVALNFGLNITSFGEAIDNGLNLGTFSQALKVGFDAREFAGLVRRNDIETVNNGLEHFVDCQTDESYRLSPVERVARMWGEEVVAAC